MQKNQVDFLTSELCFSSSHVQNENFRNLRYFNSSMAEIIN